MDLKEVGCRLMYRISQARDRDRWHALVNTVMNLGFHKIPGISLPTDDLLSFSGRTLRNGRVRNRTYTSFLASAHGVTGLNSEGNLPTGSRDTVCRNLVRHDFPDPWNSSSRCSDVKLCTVS